MIYFIYVYTDMKQMNNDLSTIVQLHFRKYVYILWKCPYHSMTNWNKKLG